MGRSHHYDNQVIADYSNLQLAPLPAAEELPDHLVPGARMEVLIQNEAVGDGDVEKKVIYVFVKLPSLGAAAIVALQLITVINCTHPCVV